MMTDPSGCRSLDTNVTDSFLGPPTRRVPRGALLLLRLLVSIVMLTILVARIPTDDLGDILPGWRSTSALWLLGAAAATAVAFVLSAMRWQQVTRTLGLDCRLGQLLNHYLAGQFVGNFLPTTIGGDVLRVTRLGRDTGDRPNAFASVLIERLTGWVVLPLMTLIALIINRGLLRESGGRAVLTLAIGTLVVLCAVVWAAEHPRMGGRVMGDGAVRQQLGAVHVGLGVYREHPDAAQRVILVGVAYQSMLVLATALAGAALGIDPGPTAWLAYAPMVLIVQVLPVGFGGLGVREGALAWFLAPHGVTSAEALLLGLLLYVLNLLVSLAGAPSFALGGRRAADEADPEVVG